MIVLKIPSRCLPSLRLFPLWQLVHLSHLNSIKYGDVSLHRNFSASSLTVHVSQLHSAPFGMKFEIFEF